MSAHVCCKYNSHHSLFEHGLLVRCNQSEKVYFFDYFPAFSKVVLFLNADFSIHFVPFALYLCMKLIVETVMFEIVADCGNQRTGEIKRSEIGENSHAGGKDD